MEPNISTRKVLFNTNLIVYNKYIQLSKNIIKIVESINKLNIDLVNKRIKTLDLPYKLYLFIKTLNELGSIKPITFTQILNNIYNILEILLNNIKELKNTINNDNERYFNYLRSPSYYNILDKLYINNRILNERLQFIINI